MSFAGKEITPEQINARSELAKDRACVSCGAKIRRGHICDCQAEGAVNCPVCKGNIKDPAGKAKLEPGTGSDNWEVRIYCRRMLPHVTQAAPGAICPGYLYSYVYKEDFVPFNPGA